MKSDRKKIVNNKRKSKAAGGLAGKTEIAQQYERLCQLREKVRVLSEKARSTRAKGQH